jgi:hypothetical protein
MDEKHQVVSTETTGCTIVYHFEEWQISDIELAMNHLDIKIEAVYTNDKIDVLVHVLEVDEDEFDAILEELEEEWIDPIELEQEKALEWGQGDFWLRDLNNGIDLI